MSIEEQIIKAMQEPVPTVAELRKDINKINKRLKRLNDK